MSNLPASEVRKRFAEVLNEVQFNGQRVVLDRHGKSVAALVPVADLELLELLEDRLDLEEARQALEEPGENVSLEALKAQLGL